MKNPEINIVKKMSNEQKKLLLFAPIGIIILIISIYVLFSPSDTTSKNDIVNDNTKYPMAASASSNNDWDLPIDSKDELPGSTLEITDELNKANQKNKNNNRDFFEDLENKSPRTNRRESKNTKKDSMILQIQSQLQGLQKKKIKRNTVRNTRKENTNAIVPKETKKEKELVNNNINVNDFFSNKANSNNYNNETNSNSIKGNKPEEVLFTAVISGDQKIKNGDRIVLRTLNSVIINGRIIKKNTFIYAFAKFGKNRVQLSINRIGETQVSLKAYDVQDGEEGIYIEGANVTNEIKREVTDQTIDDVDADRIPFGNTLKNIFKKKNKEIDVYLMNNYELILKTI